LVDAARREATRTLEAIIPYVERGVPVIGLEPSCLLTFRDEFGAILPGPGTNALAEHAVLFEEFLAREVDTNTSHLDFRSIGSVKALLHGHCHQKAFGAMPSIDRVLRAVPGLEIESVDSTCCGMAGSFGFEVEHYDVSMRIGELGLFPSVRAALPDTWIIADGTSCRRQIADGTGRSAVHAAVFLERFLGGGDQRTER
jgi:Fe-S oxidoreductase